MDPLSSSPQIHFGRAPLEQLSPFTTARNSFHRLTSPSWSSLVGDSVKIKGPKESLRSASSSPNKLKRKRSSSSVKEGSEQAGVPSRPSKKMKTSKPKKETKEALEGQISLIQRQQASDKKGLAYNLSQPAGTRVWDNNGGRHLYTGTEEHRKFIKDQYGELFRSQDVEIAQKQKGIEKLDNGVWSRISPFSRQGKSLDDSSIDRGRSQNRSEGVSQRSRSAPNNTTYSSTSTLARYSDSGYSSSNETLSGSRGEQRYQRSSSTGSYSNNPTFPSSAKNLSNRNYAFWKAPLLWTPEELKSAKIPKVPRILGYSSGKENPAILPAFTSEKNALKLRLPTRKTRSKIAATVVMREMPTFLENQYNTNGRKTVPFMAFDIEGREFNGLSSAAAFKKGMMYAPFMGEPGNTRVYCFPPSIAKEPEAVNVLHNLNSRYTFDFHHYARFPQGLRTET